MLIEEHDPSLKRVGSVHKLTFQPSPRQAKIQAPSFSEAPGHTYDFQVCNASEGRFEYDGCLPQINSKYRKQSIDIDMSKQSPRNSQALEVPMQGLTYDVQSMNKPSTNLFYHKRISELKVPDTTNDREVYNKQVRGLVSRGAPMQLLMGAASAMEKVRARGFDATNFVFQKA